MIAHRQAIWPRVARPLRGGGWRRAARSFRSVLPHACELAGRLRAVHGRQGGARARRVDGVGAGHRPTRPIGDRTLVGPLRSGHPAAQTDAVRVFRAVAARARCLPLAIDRHHGRPADLRRTRQCRRLGAPRSLPTRRRRPANCARRCAARLLQRNRPVVGQSALPMGGDRRHRLSRGGSSGFARLLALVDRVRIDHFRGFVASWEVPRGATTAMSGEWVAGPGCRALRSRAISAGNGSAAVRRGEPRRDHAGRGSAARTGCAFPGWPFCSSPSETTRRLPISSLITTRATLSSTPGLTTTTRRSAGGPATSATAHGLRPR